MVSSVSSVNNVSPSPNPTQGQPVRAMDKVSQEQIYSPGIYSMQELMATERPPYREKHGFLKFLFKVAVATVVVGGAAAFGRKHIGTFKNIDLDVKPEKFGEKIKYQIARFGEFVNEKVIAKISNKWQEVKPKSKVTKAEEAAKDAAPKAEK